jgi:HD-like signal output (HDOD) protein
MTLPRLASLEATENVDFIHGLLERRLSCGELDVPMLPEVALRIVRMGQEPTGNSHSLSETISADPTLALHVMRIAGSAANRPAQPITSLQHAVSWLGFTAVSNIAFTVALQAKMLNFPTQRHRGRLLWRHALASALWARQIAGYLNRDAAQVYLCGLLHGIGRAITLGAVGDLAQRAKTKLSGEEIDRLIESFNRAVGMSVAASWSLPSVVCTAIAHWDNYREAEQYGVECNVVNLAHRLANLTLGESGAMARDLLLADCVLSDLGLTPESGAALFDAQPQIALQMDKYLGF